jgi:hypothetical protein
VRPRRFWHTHPVRPSAVLLLCALACRPSALAPLPAPGTLEGLELPLAAAPSLRLAVDGRLGPLAIPALVELDPGQPMTFISQGCGLEPSFQSPTLVPNPFGGVDALAVVRVEALVLGGVRVAPFRAGLVEGEACRLALGDEVLGPLALELRLATRTVRLTPSLPLQDALAALPPGDEVQVLRVAREPRFDWPLVTVRVAQGRARLEATLLFSAREPWTRLYEAPVRAAGLKPRRELLEALNLPRGVTLPESLRRFQGLAVDRLELAPGVGVDELAVELEAGEAPRVPQGVLGADVWGRFDARIDLGQGVVVLHRPRLDEARRCQRAGVTSAEACVQVSSRKVPGGFALGAVVWRPLPEGARLTLDLRGTEAPCRLGLAFPPTDRGRSAWHQVPWPRLAQALPGCAASLAAATSLEPALFEEGPLAECSGVCAFAQDRATGALSCECQPSRRTEDEAAERLLVELSRRFTPDAGAAPEPEPRDP